MFEINSHFYISAFYFKQLNSEKIISFLLKQRLKFCIIGNFFFCSMFDFGGGVTKFPMKQQM